MSTVCPQSPPSTLHRAVVPEGRVSPATSVTGQLNLPGYHIQNGQQMAPRLLPEPPGRFVVWLWVDGGQTRSPSSLLGSHPLLSLSALPFQAAESACREGSRQE